MKQNYIKQLFEDTANTAYDSNAYCNFDAASSKALAGKDLLLAVWNTDGTKILAVAGQQSLNIKRSADTIEVTSKDTANSWKSYIAGMKEWSIDSDGLFTLDDESHKILSTAFENGDPVCLKVYNKKTKAGMFGGLAVLTDYPIDAPYDDAVTWSTTFQGQGTLVDLSLNKPTTDTLPE